MSKCTAPILNFENFSWATQFIHWRIDRCNDSEFRTKQTRDSSSNNVCTNYLIVSKRRTKICTRYKNIQTKCAAFCKNYIIHVRYEKVHYFIFFENSSEEY